MGQVKEEVAVVVVMVVVMGEVTGEVLCGPVVVAVLQGAGDKRLIRTSVLLCYWCCTIVMDLRGGKGRAVLQ